MQVAMEERKDLKKDYSYLKRNLESDPLLDQKIPWIEIGVLIGAAQSPLVYYFIQSLWYILPQFGWDMPNCSENKNFLMNNLYGIETFNAFAAVPIALVLSFFGIVRAMKKRKWALHFIAAGIALVLWNAYITYESVVWYTSTSNAASVENATGALKKYGEAQEAYRARTGAYADSMEKLGGDFTFANNGTIAIVEAGPNGVVAEAQQACLQNRYYWNTASGLRIKTPAAK